VNNFHFSAYLKPEHCEFTWRCNPAIMVHMRANVHYEEVREDQGKGKQQMEALHETISEMQNSERSLLIDRSAQATQMYYSTIASILLGSLLGLLAIAAFGWLLWRYWLSRTAAAAEIWHQRERLRTTLSSIGDAVIATD
jgi:hypothetical protein